MKGLHGCCSLRPCLVAFGGYSTGEPWNINDIVLGPDPLMSLRWSKGNYDDEKWGGAHRCEQFYGSVVQNIAAVIVETEGDRRGINAFLPICASKSS